jgi:hypothetical protein
LLDLIIGFIGAASTAMKIWGGIFLSEQVR